MKIIQQKNINKKIIALPILALFIGVGGFFAFNRLNKADAYLSGFDAGNIISDYVMSNKSTMSEADINNFLHSKVNCNDTNLSKADPYGRQNYHIENGHFVCMADEKFSGYIGPYSENHYLSNVSAARAIYESAQRWNINPQVLIVLLQKEQGLITDSWPNAGQYRSATGFGCPDTAPCDSQYYGLVNQIDNAAYLFRNVLDNDYSRFKSGTTQYVQYNPNAGCGGSNVYIQNRATAALYRYTPYQPNQSALNAGWGTGDGCSAYGNRNFYNYFTDWFGNTQKTPNYTSIPDGKYYISSVLNPNKTIEFGSDTLLKITDKSISTGFTFSKNSDNTYYIQDSSGKVIDIPGGNAQSGSSLQGWEINNTDAQKWYLLLNNDGSYTFVSKVNQSYVFDISGGKVEDNAAIQLYQANNTKAQKFYLVSPSQPVPDATYTIAAQSNPNMVIDISGGSKANGANVHLYSTNNTDAQKWTLTYDPNNGYYTIKNPISDKVLDVAGGLTANGSNVDIYSGNSTCAQKWRIVPFGNDAFEILSSCSNKALDIDGGRIINTGNIQLWDRNGSGAQRWVFKKIEVPAATIPDATYTIAAQSNPNMVIDISGGSKANGANVHLYSTNNTDAQKWTLTYDPNNGYYTIKNPISDKVLDVAGGLTANGSNVDIYSGNSTCAQKWRIVPFGNDAFEILSSCSNKALDIDGGRIINTGNIQLWDRNGSGAQRWVFKKIEVPAATIPDATYTIAAQSNPNMVIDISGGSKANGANVHLYSTNNTDAQKWTLTYDPNNGYYTIKNPISDKVLDVAGGLTANGSNVDIYSGNSTCAQKWRIVPFGNDAFEILSSCSNKALDIDGGRIINTGNIQLWDRNGSGAQRWVFKKL